MRVLGSDIDWTQVIVAFVVGLPATLGAVFAYLNGRALRTPSGDRPGALIERTHELAIVNTELTAQTHKAVANGVHTQPSARPTTEEA